MISYLDKLNLRPQERRLVLIVAFVVFVVINVWLVYPHFGDVGKHQQKISDTRRAIAKYETEIKKRPEYERQLAKLREAGGYVASDEQALALSRDVAEHARSVGLFNYNVSGTQRSSGARTNAFFEEQGISMTFNGTDEKILVEFLYRLASGNSLIRVRSMDLKPELPNRYKIQGSLTLVESFQKKPPPKSALAKPAAATPKPADAKPAPATNTGAKPVVTPKPATTTTPPAKTNPPPAAPNPLSTQRPTRTPSGAK